MGNFLFFFYFLFFGEGTTLTCKKTNVYKIEVFVWKKMKMNTEFSLKPPCSIKEEDVIGESAKKFKESTGARQSFQPHVPVSYKDTLLGDIPGAYEQAFKFDLVKDDVEDSNSDLEPLIEGMVDVKLPKETLLCIREPWSKALIVKVFGRTVDDNYLTFKINALWKPAAKLDCVHLGRDFFLIRFNYVDDYDKVLKGGSLVYWRTLFSYQTMGALF